MSPATPLPTNTHLRRAPPRAALMTLAEQLLPGAQIARVRRLPGGIASGMHALSLRGSAGERLEVVLRRYGPDTLSEDPRSCEHEWQTLKLLERHGLPAPRPLWIDAGGVHFDTPSMVVSRLAGRGTLTPRAFDRWIDGLADHLAGIHRAPYQPAELDHLIDQRVEIEEALGSGSFSVRIRQHPDGERLLAAIGRLWSTLPVVRPALLHGDYWPGNTLWRYGRCTGVVDWEQARRGDAGQDVGYCRMDLYFVFGAGPSDRFLQSYQRASGLRVERVAFWDLCAALRPMPDPAEWLPGYVDLGRFEVTARQLRERHRGWIEDALGRTG